MSEPFIPPVLIAPGVNDARSRAFIGSFSALLSEFTTAALIVQDAWSAPTALLPAMTIEAGLSELVSPGMREDYLRALIDDAPAIHAMTGSVAGTKRALAALGITARWTQWWQAEPKAHHNTHKVVLYFSDTVIDGEQPMAIPNQRAAARVIAATKRESQDIVVQYGIRAGTRVRIGAVMRRSRTVRLSAPRLGDEHFAITSFIGCAAHAVRRIRINAKV